MASYDKLAKVGVSTVGDIEYRRGNAAEESSKVKGAVGCFTHIAAHLWPYKLVMSMLAMALSAGVNLQTHTPVRKVSSTPDASGYSKIETDRGSIHARKVIYASNAYTSDLLPQFKHKIVPVRGICSRIVTPEPLPSQHVLPNNCVLRFNDWEYDYLIPRADGSIIVGGARRDYLRDLDQWYDVIDDSKLIQPAAKYFDGYMQRTFKGWENSGAYTDKVWTGIMGYSSDGMPHVGQVPKTSNQYICAGFTGHGMSQIFLSAKALADMVVNGRPVEEVDLPRLYRASQERLDAPGNATLETWRAIPQETRTKL